MAATNGDDAGARQLYESILAEDNYYSAMAAARLNRQVSPNPLGVPLDTSYEDERGRPYLAVQNNGQPLRELV